MPYLDMPATTMQRAFSLADDDLPDAGIVVGQWSQRGYFHRVGQMWPDAREVETHTLLVTEVGCRIWISVVLGAAMAATFAHLQAKLGAKAIVQVGTFGGLATGWDVGDVLIPSLVVGRDGVSRQLARNRPIEPDAALAAAIRREVRARLDGRVHEGTLVTTTTISFERTSDLARWTRAGHSGVEMECAATLSVARHFGLPAAGAFALQDNLAVGHTVFDPSTEDLRRIRASKDAILRGVVTALVNQL